MNTKEKIETVWEYRNNMVRILCAMCDKLEEIYPKIDNGGLPAYPDEYRKGDWEETNETIEQIVFNYIVPSIEDAMKDYKDCLVLEHCKSFIESVQWYEV